MLQYMLFCVHVLFKVRLRKTKTKKVGVKLSTDDTSCGNYIISVLSSLVTKVYKFLDCYLDLAVVTEVLQHICLY